MRPQHTPPVPEAPRPRELLGLGLVALAVFVAEVALMRAVAQVTWPPFAFLALSAAMLGGGVAGTALAVRPRWVARPGLPAGGALAVGVGAPVAMAVALFAGLEPVRVGADGAATARFVLALGALAVPFVGLALVLSALLERAPARATRAYGADLVGAALGAFGALPLMEAFGTAATGCVAGALGGLAAVTLGASRGQRGAGVLVTVAALALAAPMAGAVPVATGDKRVHWRPTTETLRRLAAAGELVTADGPDGRVDAVPGDPTSLVVDLGAAITRVPPADDAALAAIARKDPAWAAFEVRPPTRDVLVIGSGGGWEVAGALHFGAPHVDAVEVSAGVVEVARRLPGAAALYDDPRVDLHLEEARAFLERRPEDRTYGHVVASHTITNAAFASSAMRLAEDFLLTREALETMLAHLAPRGVLYLTRPRQQIGLLADLARAALRGRGVPGDEVDAHLALVTRPEDPFFAGLLVFEDAAYPRGTSRRGLALPGGFRAEPPPAPTGRALPTDDRPFFHRGADDETRGGVRLAIEGPRLAERSLRIVGLLATALALVVVVLPLRLRREVVGPPPRPAALAVAALLGLAFMILELSLVQRSTLHAGRPVIAFAAVVGGMLLGAGGVALVTPSRRVTLVGALAACLGGVAVAAALPGALDALGVLAWAPGPRFAGLAAAAALAASPLGLAFPALVRDAGGVRGAAPWLFAVNSTTSVAATALHGALAPAVGTSGATWVAGGGYAAALALAAWMRRAQSGRRSR